MSSPPNPDDTDLRMIAEELLARERITNDKEPRHEWRKQNRLELLVGGAIAVVFLVLLVLLFFV